MITKQFVILSREHFNDNKHKNENIEKNQADITCEVSITTAKFRSNFLHYSLFTSLKYTHED
jgi:hypothetical protein